MQDPIDNSTLYWRVSWINIPIIAPALQRSWFESRTDLNFSGLSCCCPSNIAWLWGSLTLKLFFKRISVIRRHISCKNHSSMKLHFWSTGTFCLHLHFWIMLLLCSKSFFSFSCKIPVVVGGLCKGELSLCWILSLLVQTIWIETHGQHDKMKLNVLF